MINKNLIFLLSILVLLLNQVHVNAVAQEYVPRNIDVERSPKNILVGSYVGGRSHLKPMLDVTTILIERGHNVILLTSGKYEPSSEYPGLKQITLGSKSLTAKNDRRINIHKEVDYRTMGKFMELATATYNVTYEKFKNAAKEDNIDLFICDALVNQACIDVANNLNKPLVGFTSFMQMMEPKPYKSDPMYGCNISLENESFFERFRCTLIQPLQIAYAYGPSIRKLNDIKGQMNINPVSEKEPKFSLSLVDTFFGFELPQSSAPNVQEIGPVLSEEYPPLTPELSDFINGHRRVLYVAFGTRFYTTIENNNKILQSLYEAINNKMVDGVVWALSETSKDDFSPTLNFIDDDDFLKEWIPAESRMGFIKANNLDVYGSLLIIIPALIGIAFNLIKHTSNSLFNRKKSKQA
ncbi:glycosyltransferase family 1 protein [Rhizophagus irregularis DAOM 181602=DAOM 197198]|nr:glycosyltransferase family 1 protein [Rhizophagus irregularis DAOM 181602=DAOM 197198]